MEDVHGRHYPIKTPGPKQGRRGPSEHDTMFPEPKTVTVSVPKKRSPPSTRTHRVKRPDEHGEDEED